MSDTEAEAVWWDWDQHEGERGSLVTKCGPPAVDPNRRRTLRMVNKFEKARIIGVRASQLEMNAPSTHPTILKQMNDRTLDYSTTHNWYVPPTPSPSVQHVTYTPLEIAEMELRDNVSPLQLIRNVGERKEIWNLTEMIGE